ncbi:hypothetical protein BJ944DRAFT_231177 [Cunninghamella echinulata]|nr:hypothetical protein BJ944DRAFT_231177 [Cunninghamella echinulata]
MDDFYQYTASAVNANENKNNNTVEQDEQNDPLIKAFTNFGWGQRFNSLIDTVKKQSEVIVDVTKKDLQEIASVLRDDSSDLVDQLSLSTTSTNTITPDNNPTREASTSSNNINTAATATEAIDSDADINDNNKTSNNLFSSFKENLEKINTVNFSSLRDGLTNTLNQTLPTQLTSIKLPDNINLGELRQELDEGTKFAEQYIQKFGTEVIQVLNRTITVLEPDENDDDDDDNENNDPLNQATGPKIYATRKEALIAKLQQDNDSFLKDPKDSLTGDDIKIFETFNSGFHAQDYTEEIAKLLDESPELRQTMDNLVPIQVDYTTFWQRYFYHIWKIDEEDKRRQLIVKGVDEHEDEADFKWDSDDEDNNNNNNNNNNVSTISDKQKPEMKATNIDEISHDTNKSDTDFSNISEPPSTEASLVSPPLKYQTDGDDWIRTSTSEEKKQDQDDDSDSDWE